jgi:hypothetical protein
LSSTSSRHFNIPANSELPCTLKFSNQSILISIMILSWNLASRGCVIIWISASYLEHIPMKCRPPYLSYI